MVLIEIWQSWRDIEHVPRVVDPAETLHDIDSDSILVLRHHAPRQKIVSVI
jgi:hypothetical protein